eukprot:COSAG06_NODE_304_length_17855_cov_47.399414_22_plen_61_part_00
MLFPFEFCCVYCELHYNRPFFTFSYCFQGQFCKLPLLRVIFNRKLGGGLKRGAFRDASRA